MTRFQPNQLAKMHYFLHSHRRSGYCGLVDGRLLRHSPAPTSKTSFKASKASKSIEKARTAHGVHV
ncbi:MAG: hypothetical protein ACPIOQ_49925 [Promethearchaeia archaeon]